MLGTQNAIATVAVKDLAVARKFYEETLGLTRTSGESKESATYRTGASSLFVYTSRFAGTNQATSVTWRVGDEVERIVEVLREKGVRFEHYEFPNLVLKGDVHHMGEVRAAWLKDPDGNIHAIVNR